MRKQDKPADLSSEHETHDSEAARGVVDPRLVGLATLTRGYAEAVARFRAHQVNPTTLDDAYLPLFEALNWATSIEEYLADPEPHLKTENDHVRGTRFVRNRVHHQWAQAIDFKRGTRYGEGAYGAGPYGGDPSTWVWLPKEDLPTPDQRLTQRQAADSESYKTRLAGSPVAATLDALATFFGEQEEKNDAR